MLAVLRNTGEGLSMATRWWIVALASAAALNVSAEHYPYSMGRALGKQDDNEFILLHVPELLKAR